jgi:nitrogen regulatory protein P-II 1
MKEIKAIIRPARLTKVRDAFRKLEGFPGMTISKVQGCSEHEGEESHLDIRDELTDFSGKVRIEMLVHDDLMEKVVDIIHQHAYTGQKGDGILWVSEVVEFRRLCKREAG